MTSCCNNGLRCLFGKALQGWITDLQDLDQLPNESTVTARQTFLVLQSWIHHGSSCVGHIVHLRSEKMGHTCKFQPSTIILASQFLCSTCSQLCHHLPASHWSLLTYEQKRVPCFVSQQSITPALTGSLELLTPLPLTEAPSLEAQKDQFACHPTLVNVGRWATLEAALNVLGKQWPLSKTYHSENSI